jgi:hypothetical protein
MEVEFSLKHDEFFESCKMIQEYQKKPKLQLKLLSWIFLALIFCVGFNYYYTEGSKQGLMFLIVGCCVGWISFAIIYMQYFKQVQSNFFPDSDGLVLGKRTLKITPKGIEQNNSHFSSIYNWTTVKSVIETQNVFIMLFDKALFQAIPKSIFDEKGLSQFSSLINEYHGDINQFNMLPEPKEQSNLVDKDGW